MEPRIEAIAEKKLAGKSLQMTIVQDRTAELWRSFMPERKKITNAIGSDLYSLQVYDAAMEFKDFTPQTVFTKWALQEVSNLNEVPEGMLSFVLTGGLYAVFNYKGRPQDYAPTFQYIFSEWMPLSGYEVDKRPHFELLGEKYKNNDPDSEEEIWVPIKKRI
ncbi:MAG: hypothetical protein JWO03_555 [Bacteroidetes bacterium]|nr:hypothetical protein [Bacteroidota bacterium]